MKFTLRMKLVALTIFLVTIIMANVTYFFTIRELKSNQAATEKQIERIAQNIATIQLLDQADWSVYQNYINQLLTVNDDIVYIAIYDDRQMLRAHALNQNLIDIDPNRPLTRIAQAGIVRRLDNGGIAKESQEDLRTQTVNIQVGERVLGSVHVGFSLIEINDYLRSGITRNILLAVFFFLIFGALAYFLSVRVSRPLERLSLAMSEVAKGDLEQRVMVENKDEIGQLANRFNEMVDGLRERQIIESLSQELGATFQLRRLAVLVRGRLSGAIGAGGARLFLRRRNGEELFYEIPSRQDQSHSAARFILDAKEQASFLNAQYGLELKFVPNELKVKLQRAGLRPDELLIPMTVKGKLFGFLVFCAPDHPNGFDDKQRHFAATLAGQAALALENAMLYDELREQERIKRELEIAREVQLKLLPSALPRVPEFEFDAICYPAQEVGGDYYDFFLLDKDHLGIVIADVSGKGTSASFYMAEIKGMMTSLASRHSSPKSLLAELNQQLYGSLDRKIFATMIYGILNKRTGDFRFARAGHNALIHRSKNGQCNTVLPPGIGIGLESGDIFGDMLQEAHVLVQPGDFLIFYTDGITEAMDSKREVFGDERLLALLNANHVSSPKKLRQAILEEVKTFVNGAHQQDDLTMVVVRRQESRHASV